MTRKLLIPIIATLALIIGVITLTVFPATAEIEPDVPGGTKPAPEITTTTVPTTIVVDGVTYTEAQIQGWVAAVERAKIQAWIAAVERYKARLLWERIARFSAAYQREQARRWFSFWAKKAAQAKTTGGTTVQGIVVCNGTTLPSCAIVKRESGFNPTIKNPHSTASGLYQFINSTWRTCGTGYPTAASAPVAVQVGCARRIWNNGRGASHWSL